MDRKPTVISIAAVSGGGKTTVTRELSENLRCSKKQFFDDYDFKDSPEDLTEWVQEGSDYDQWNLDPFIRDIQSILTDNERVSYLILDYPFAYKHSSMKEYIDLSVYIDTPLDIA
ncbi:MAG: hypothetical protein WBV93_04520, partial [Anaerobacillus sp.]